MKLTDTIIRAIAIAGFRDRARPVEWLSVFALSGWAQFLLQSPETFAAPQYASFSALPPTAWAVIIVTVVAAQLAAMTPIGRAGIIRWVAMAFATGLWVVIAMNFWTSDATPISARTASSIALICGFTGVYLGWQSTKS